MADLRQLPGPSGLPWLGNLHQLPAGSLTQHFTALAPQFDGLFAINFAGHRVPFVTQAALVAEMADESRFRKRVGPPLSMLRRLAGDGLFTADSGAPNWTLAHRILIPAFSQRTRRDYFGPMWQVAQQLVAHWQRHGAQGVDVSADMTRLTLDTIALCGFDYPFNSFERADAHPFVAAMVRVLDETMGRMARHRYISRLRWRANRQFQDDIAYLHQVVDDVVAQRRAAIDAGQAVPRDLLTLMLQAADPKTGQRLSDTNIRYQVITFLIAGHETTSGLLSFALHALLRHPEVLARCKAEVDAVLPNGQLTYDDLDRLVVLEQTLSETLRLWPTAPAYSLSPFDDVTLGGRFAIPKETAITVLLPALHRDPQAWDEPERFDIDRFSPERIGQIKPHAYKPFGHGSRACIGRQFALMEAKIALALVLHHFDLSADATAPLVVRETLTLKPEGFTLRARPRRERVAAV